MKNSVIKSKISRFVIPLAVISAIISPVEILAHDFVSEGIAYNIEEGIAIVTYKGNYSSSSYYLTDVVIPEEVTYKDKTYPVTAIGNYAFNNCYLLSSIILPPTITEIRAGAFSGCKGLACLDIPEGVSSIGDYALQNSGLQSLSFSCRQIGKDALTGLSSLETIESPYASTDGKCLIIDGVLRLFAPVGITEYAIPETVHTIDSGIFSSNNELEYVTLPSGLETIRAGAFNYCNSLKQINIPSSVKVIESSFSCNSLTKILIEDINSYCHISGYKGYNYGLFNNEVDLENYEGTPIYDITFPGDVKTLGLHLFAKTKIHSLIIEEGVEEIQYDALRDCKYLSSVSIPASVSKIGNQSFRGCFRLTDFIYGATNATAGYHVKEDRDDEHAYIFTDCPSLTHVKLLETVTNIPDYLFAQSNIKSIDFPSSVQNIGNAVFYLGQIEEVLFESMPEIGAVFTGCNRLAKVTVLSSIPPVSSNLGNVTSASLYVPENSVDLYSEAPGWSKFKAILVEPTAGTVGHIFESDNLRFEITDQEKHLCKVTSPLAGNDYYGEIIIPDSVVADNGQIYSVTSVGENAFTYTSKVTSIKIPNTILSVSWINNTTVGLREIIVDEDNELYRSIDGVLYDKDAINLLIFPAAKPGPYTVPQTVENVGSNLAAKINLDELIISDSVKGELYLSNSPSLKYLKIGSGVSSFSVANCPALEYLEIGSGVQAVKGENFGAGYHDLWTTNNIKTLIFADSPNPIQIYTMSVDDGYLSAIPTSNCRYVYIGRDLKATGSPLWRHFSSPVDHVEFGPEVTRLDVQLLQSMQYGVTKISVPSADFWASVPRLYSGTQPNYSLYIDGKDMADIRITSEKIQRDAFRNVNNLKTITLAENVHNINSYAFDTYPHLESLILENCNPDNITVNGDLLRDYDLVELSVPHETKHLYSDADYWKKFANIVERETTGLETPNIQPELTTGHFYDLHGRLVSGSHQPHGIYIMKDNKGKTFKIKL